MSGGGLVSSQDVWASDSGEEFHEVSRRTGICEKFRECCSKRLDDDEFGGGKVGIHRAQPASKALPHRCSLFDGEQLQQALCDTTELDESMVGTKLSTHGLLVGGGSFSDVLISAAAFAGRHVSHPEVVRIRPEHMDSLAETNFDLEPVTIERDHVEWVKCEIGRHEDELAPLRMTDEDEAHELSCWPPE